MKVRRLVMMAMLALALPAPASAELRHVKIDTPGMDCASCARAMSAALKKLDGVESVDLIVEKSSVEIRLRADNRVTLDRIRREMRAFGYQTRDAEITARGKVIEQEGKPFFDLQNGSRLELTAQPDEKADGLVEITGVSKTQENADRLTIGTLRGVQSPDPGSLIAHPESQIVNR